MRQRAMMWTQILCFVAVLVVGAVCIVYTNRVDSESNRQWCEIVVTLDDSYTSRPKDAPPLTTVGQRVADEMRRLRRDFNC